MCVWCVSFCAFSNGQPETLARYLADTGKGKRKGIGKNKGKGKYMSRWSYWIKVGQGSRQKKFLNEHTKSHNKERVILHRI